MREVLTVAGSEDASLLVCLATQGNSVREVLTAGCSEDASPLVCYATHATGLAVANLFVKK